MPQRHSKQKQENTAALQAAGISFISANRGEALLIRAGNFRADFFPSTCKTLLHRDGKEPEVREWDSVANAVNWLKQKIANATPVEPPKQKAPKPQPKPSAPPAQSGRVMVFKTAVKKR